MSAKPRIHFRGPVGWMACSRLGLRTDDPAKVTCLMCRKMMVRLSERGGAS
jgi:hypothetical protein